MKTFKKSNQSNEFEEYYEEEILPKKKKDSPRRRQKKNWKREWESHETDFIDHDEFFGR